MARKVKARTAEKKPVSEPAPAVPAAEPVAAVSVAPQEPRVVRRALSRHEIDGLARWAAEAKYVDIYLELKERDRRELLARIDPNNELAPIDQRIAGARAAKAKAASMYMKVAEQASQRLGVNVTDYGYDDETGLLSVDPIPKE